MTTDSVDPSASFARRYRVPIALGVLMLVAVIVVTRLLLNYFGAQPIVEPFKSYIEQLADASPEARSELQRYLAWAPALLGVLVALIGFILAGGGAYLAALGGSRYYVLVGVMLLAAGYLMIKGRIAILRLRRRVRVHVRLGLLGSRAVGLAIDSASCRTLRPPRPGDSGRSRTRPDDWTARAQVGLSRRRNLRCRARHPHPDLQSAPRAEPTARCASKRFVRRSRVCAQEG